MATPNLTGITTVTPFTVSAQLAAGDNALLTIGVSQAAKLAPLLLHNTSAGTSVTVIVSVVPSGGTVDTTHRIAIYALSAGETITIDEVNGMWLAAGAVVNVNASVASLVDATLTGLQFS